MKSNIKQQLNLRDEADGLYHTELENEIRMWRAELRESEYLLVPQVDREHTSLSNKDLDSGLVNFSQKCKDNRIFFFREAFKNNTVKYVPLEPIFFNNIDKTTFHSIEKKTKTEISARITEILENLLDLDYDVGMLTMRYIAVDFIFYICHAV